MRNTVFMVNQAFCEDTFDGDFGQQLKKGMDELLIVKLWKKGATTEVRGNDSVREGVTEYRYSMFLVFGVAIAPLSPVGLLWHFVVRGVAAAVAVFHRVTAAVQML